MSPTARTYKLIIIIEEEEVVVVVMMMMMTTTKLNPLPVVAAAGVIGYFGFV